MKKWILFLMFLGITANADYFRQADQPSGTHEAVVGGCGAPTGACG